MLDTSDLEFVTKCSPSACVRIIAACVKKDAEIKSDLWRQLINQDFCEKLSDASTARDLFEVVFLNETETSVEVFDALSSELGMERFRKFMNLRGRRGNSTQIYGLFKDYLREFERLLHESSDERLKRRKNLLLIAISRGAAVESIFIDLCNGLVDSNEGKASFSKAVLHLRDELKILPEKIVTRSALIHVSKRVRGDELRRWVIEFLDQSGFSFSAILDRNGAAVRTVGSQVGAMVQAIAARKHIETSVSSLKPRAGMAAGPSLG